MRTRTLLAALLCAALTPPAAAAEAHLAGVDGMMATVMQEGQSSFSGIGLRMRITSPMFIEGVEFMPTVEYWRNANSVQPFGITTRRKDATLGMDVRYVFHSTSLKPYIGGGYALHFLSSAVNAPSLGVNNQTDALIKGGLAVMGGASFSLAGRLDNFVELKYHHVPSYRQLKLNWGIAVKL